MMNKLSKIIGISVQFINSLISTIILISVSFVSHAHTLNSTSPVGTWITIDRHSNKPSGAVMISERQGKLYGKIIAGYNVDPIIYCTHCPGNFKNKPVIGLEFLWGFSQFSHNKWKNGYILNPHDGNIYRASITLTDAGKKLLLRGYWGIFFQTEIWIRSVTL